MTRDLIEEWDQLAEQGGFVDWRYSHDERERLRARVLGDRLHEDIWVFAYGSLMWDPGFHFDEVRYATLDGASRSFRLLDTIGRGTPARPGLMAGLGRGGNCHGLAFRIAARQADAETDVIWMREMISPGYVAEFQALETPQGAVEGVAFFLDEACEHCLPSVRPDRAAKLIATGEGPGGTSRDYLEKLVVQMYRLGIEDAPVRALLASVEDYANSAN